jgi:hypothetical protein
MSLIILHSLWMLRMLRQHPLLRLALGGYIAFLHLWAIFVLEWAVDIEVRLGSQVSFECLPWTGFAPVLSTPTPHEFRRSCRKSTRWGLPELCNPAS